MWSGTLEIVGKAFPRRQADMADKAKLEDPKAIKEFVLSGKAFFTLVSKKTGARFTYRVAPPKDGVGIHFVNVLVGPDNWTNYKYFGHIRDGKFAVGKKSKIDASAPSVQAFAWFWKNLDTCLSQMDFWHEGKCGKCGKKLTVPASVSCGFGPECADAMGVPWKVETGQTELPGMSEACA
jgi:hypothetical protein